MKTTKAYSDGRQAFGAGAVPEDNPKRSKRSRANWLAGYEAEAAEVRERCQRGVAAKLPRVWIDEGLRG